MKEVLLPTNPEEYGKAINQLEYLIEIAIKAHELEKYLGSNSGASDEWPIKITADNEEAQEKINQLLSALNKSLLPFRSEHLETLDGKIYKKPQINLPRSGGNN